MKALAVQAWPILRNDLRLAWRELHRGQPGVLRRWGPVVLLFLLLHGPIVPMFFALKAPPPAGAQALIWLGISVLMLGGAMSRAVLMFHERSDLDLLLASPASFQAVLLARLGSIAVIVFLCAGMFVLPLANGAILALSPRYAAIYIVWALVAAITSAVGTGIMLSLVHCLGLRRGRVAAQFVAGIFSLSLFVVMALPALLGPNNFRVIGNDVATWLQHPGFRVVARANRGEPLELAALALVAGATVALTARFMARLFAAGVQDVAANDNSGGRQRAHRWRSGLERTAWRKELRLIARSPKLAGPLLAGSVVLALIATGFVRFLGPGTFAPIAFTVASFGAMFLAEIAASAEVGWDLVRLSPARESRLRGLKIGAALAAPLILAVALCVVLAVLGRPWLALLTLACSVANASACAWVGICAVRPAPRQDVIQGGSTHKLALVQIALQLPVNAGALGLGLVAFDLHAWGFCSLGVMALGALACFTLVAPDDPQNQET